MNSDVPSNISNIDIVQEIFITIVTFLRQSCCRYKWTWLIKPYIDLYRHFDDYQLTCHQYKSRVKSTDCLYESYYVIMFDCSLIIIIKINYFINFNECSLQSERLQSRQQIIRSLRFLTRQLSDALTAEQIEEINMILNS